MKRFYSIDLCLLAIVLLFVGWGYFFNENLAEQQSDSVPKQELATPLPNTTPVSWSLFQVCINTQRYISTTSKRNNAQEGTHDCDPIGYAFSIADGKLLFSAKHLFQDLDRAYQVIHRNDTHQVVNIWLHPELDLALLAIDSAEMYPDISPASSFPDKGAQVTTRVWDQEYFQHITGEILAISGRKEITTTLPLQPGHSGTPLINEEQQVVGINISIDTEKGVSHALSLHESLIGSWLFEVFQSMEE